MLQRTVMPPPLTVNACSGCGHGGSVGILFLLPMRSIQSENQAREAGKQKVVEEIQ